MTTRQRYSGVSIALHWLMLLLIVASYVLILSRTEFEKGSDARNLVKMLHFSVGVTIFALVWLRIAARLSGGAAPPITPAPNPMQHRMARLAHLALYGLMIGMPIGGLLTLGFEGDAIPYFGLFEFHLPLAENEALAEQVEELHELGGTIGYWLIGLHAAAALYHHYVRRDDTVKRMLPGR